MEDRKKKSDQIAKWGIGVTIGFFGVLFIIDQFLNGFKGIISIAAYFAIVILFLWLVNYLPKPLQMVAYSIVGIFIAFEILEQWTLVLVAAIVVGGYAIACQYLKAESSRKKAMYIMVFCLIILVSISESV